MKDSRNSWLINPWMDGSFFIAAPLLILPAFHLLSAVVSLATLKFAVLSVSATGHHLPGFIRAYTDPQLFARFRGRLLIVPALIVLLAAFAAWNRLSLVFFLLILWGTWHGILQVHGFLRIYDAKSGHHSRWAARLDLWMCLSWFVQIVLWSSGKKLTLLDTFYRAGGPLIPTQWAKALESGWLALTLAVTAAYAVETAAAARRGQLNPRKLSCLALSLAFWAWCMIGIPNLIIGLLLWEIFHDLQYNAFVWSYNRGRVDRGLSGSRVERFLFRKGRGRLLLYAACILVYGSLGFLGQDLLGIYQNEAAYGSAWRQVGNVFSASALIHFYLDGFIWKVRDPRVRADLGAAAVATAEPARQSSSFRHWAFVAVLFTTAFGMAASERFHWTEGQRGRHSASLVELVPGSAYAHFLRASELKMAGSMDSARTHYLRAIALDPAYEFTIVLVADLEVRLGDTAAAIASYERARHLDPSDPLVVGNLADLYLSSGRLREAEAAFRTLVMLQPDSPEAHYSLAFTLLRQQRGLDARPHLDRSLALDSIQPAALNYLGMVEHALGNTERALVLYRKSLELAPEYDHALRNLTTLTALP